MLKSYFTSAIRHLLKNKSYTIINVVGLSVGLACFTLIGFWVYDELSFDRFHENRDRIYRVAGTFTDESGQFDQAVTCIPLAPALKNDLPEVEDALRIDLNDATVQLNDKKFIEDGILAVDPSFLNFFDFKLISGDPQTVLQDPYTILLSESMAKKYFGDKNPIGESLKIFQYDPDGNGADYKITGVIEDCPPNSHFRYNFLFSFKTIEVARPRAFGFSGWFSNRYYTYVLLKPGSDVKQFQGKLVNFLDKYIGKEMAENKFRWTYFLQPLPDIHLKSHLRYEMKATSSFSYVLIFGTIGFITLVLAGINYINLSTAYSSSRFKEVGMRKVMGAIKNQLIGQYMVESWLLAMISLLMSLIWVELSRPLFESITGKQIINLYSGVNILLLVTTASMVGLLSGIYPAFVLSSFRTVHVLRAKFISHTSGVWLRKSLVVIQYTITILLVACIFVIQLQMRFIKNTDLGFDKDNLLVLNVNGSSEVFANYEGFANALLSNPMISGIARSNSFIAGGLGNSTATFTDASGKKVNGTVFMNGIDQDYIETYKMHLIAGRNFAEGRADSSCLIVNEATTRVYGYKNPEDAIGTEVLFGQRKYLLIGVVRNFNYNSLHQTIEPTALYLSSRGYSRIAVRLNGDLKKSVETVSAAWKKYFPNSLLDMSFAEDRVLQSYQSEQRFSKVFITFTTISLAIASLGLFALVSFSIESRTKEIGIRKVLGASVSTILTMLSKEFLLLIIMASLIAIPLGYYFMNDWLSRFAYRIDLNPSVFVIASALVLIIALFTVSARAIKAAILNPVDSLRNE